MCPTLAHRLKRYKQQGHAPLPEAVEARLARDYRARFNEADRFYTTAELLALAEGADGILPCHTEHLSAEVIARLPDRVRVVANMSVGVDHVDLGAAKSRGIVVTNTPDVSSDATAEIAMLLLPGAARRASEGGRLVRARDWRDWSPAFMVGTQVMGKRLGIVGMGRVGQVAARRGRGFDMTIHSTAAACRPNRKPAPSITRPWRICCRIATSCCRTSAARRHGLPRLCDNLDAFFAGRAPGDRVA